MDKKSIINMVACVLLAAGVGCFVFAGAIAWRIIHPAAQKTSNTVVLEPVVISAAATSDNVHIGDIALVPDTDLIRAFHLKPGSVSSSEINGTCFLEAGKTLTVVAIDDKNVLLRYSSSSRSSGGECEDGTLYKLDKSRFLELNQQYKEALEKERKEKLEDEQLRQQLNQKK